MRVRDTHYLEARYLKAVPERTESVGGSCAGDRIGQRAFWRSVSGRIHRLKHAVEVSGQLG